MAAPRDYYETLEVARTASQDEIQRAYRTLARRYHPDLNSEPGAEERFKEISEAYEVLSHPETRVRYDRFGAAWRQAPENDQPAAAGRSGAGDPAGPRIRVNTGGGRFGGPRFDGFAVPGSGEAGFVDLDYLLGGLSGGPGRPTGMRASGVDTEAELELSVEEAYAGCRRRVSLPTRSGARSHQVEVPAGVTDGQRIRLAGQGAAGVRGGPRGDLYLVVRLAPHPRYRVEGRDLTVDLPVSPWEAALGARVGFDTPAGPTRVHVPAGSSTGRRLRLGGRGLPNPRGAPGDLYAEVKVMIPERLTPQERELFQRLATVSSFDPRQVGGDRPPT